MQKTIMFSGYNCDPHDVSESYTAFVWLTILLKQFKVILLAKQKAEASIIRYYNGKLPDNLTIIGFKDKYPFSNIRLVSDNLQLGYFFFNYRINAYLKKHPEVIDKCDIIFQKSPEAFRYFTSLVQFPKPVYIGPLGGGLKPTAALKGYFKREPFLFKLRNLDKLILCLPPYKRQFEKLAKVIVAIDYLDDILPAAYLKRKEVLLNSAIYGEDYVQAVDDSGVVTIIYVGRLTRYKGAELLIKALNNIKNANFLLHILGDGEEREYLEGLVNDFGLVDKIMIHGWKTSAELKHYYGTASIFCLPTMTESLGVVFFEAMASGLPIVTINNGGPKYLCPDEGAIKIPITTEEGIINDLQQALAMLIDNPEKRGEMGAFNRKYCLENYDWKILETRILGFFNREINVHTK
ncbi:glycosyltransferase family 4 protein [Inquilinus sp. KBS0705]|nr:glycosyltransferase family 4 protein [Inquilinus sp. KBS0705]